MSLLIAESERLVARRMTRFFPAGWFSAALTLARAVEPVLLHALDQGTA